MIRSLVVCTMLALPASAQTPELPDVNQIRNDPQLDMDWVPPLILQQVIAASEDTTWFESFPATSTISQQVVKNYLLSNERTLLRKTMEIRLAIDLANAFTADEILSIYAQRVYLGASCYGFADALEHRLGTNIKDANLAQIATLAALIRGPSYFESKPEFLSARYESVLREGAIAGFWPLASALELAQSGPETLIDGAACPSQ